LITHIVSDQASNFIRRNRVDAEAREIGRLAGSGQADGDD
jgi:hypothetical protein